jgi:hypothetical protein
MLGLGGTKEASDGHHDPLDERQGGLRRAKIGSRVQTGTSAWARAGTKNELGTTVQASRSTPTVARLRRNTERLSNASPLSSVPLRASPGPPRDLRDHGTGVGPIHTPRVPGWPHGWAAPIALPPNVLQPLCNPTRRPEDHETILPVRRAPRNVASETEKEIGRHWARRPMIRMESNKDLR